MVVMADSAAPDMKATPPSMVNGSTVPAALELRAGVTHRVRFIDITAITARRVRLLDDTTIVWWTVVARAGRELPPVQRSVTTAAALLGAGQTMDVEFTPSHSGRY